MKKNLLLFLFSGILISCSTNFISANHPEAIKKLEKGNHGVLTYSFSRHNESVNFTNVYMIVENKETKKKIPLSLLSATPLNSQKHIKTTNQDKKYYSNYVLPSGQYVIKEFSFQDYMHVLSFETEIDFEIQNDTFTYLGEFTSKPIESEKGNVVLLGAKVSVDVESSIKDAFLEDSISIYQHFKYLKSLKLNKKIPAEIIRKTPIKIIKTNSTPIIISG